MSGWNGIKLEDACTKIGSGATPTGGKESYKDSGISLIRSQNVLDLDFSMDGLAFIDDEQARKLNNVSVLKNDVLINITGDSVARTCMVPEDILPARVNQHVSIVRADNINLDSYFLLYYLQYIKEHLLSISEIGATRRAITKKMIEDLVIIAPQLPEQQEIASTLYSLDEKINNLMRQNNTLDSLTETYFRQWFFEESGDALVKLGDFASLDNTGVNPGNNPMEVYSHYSIPAYDDNKTVVRELGKAILSNKFQVKPNTILVSKLNPVTPRIWDIRDKVEKNSVCSTEFQVLKPSNPRYFNYLYFLLKSYDVVGTLAMSASGTSGSHQRIRPEYILEVEIAKPDEDKIELFNAVFEDLMKKKYINYKQIQTLTALRNSLLPKLISGEVKMKM